MENVFFWWSVISTTLGVGFLCWDIWQAAINKKEREVHKAQVKIWQHHANGLSHGLMTFAHGQFSTVKDLQLAVTAAQTNAFSLYTSLNEERLFTEKEIKEKQLKTEQEWAAFRSAKPVSTNIPPTPPAKIN